MKIFADGVIESRTAAMLAPYANSRSAGAPNLSADALNRLVAMLDKRGWQILIHAIGDRAIRMSLDAFEHAASAIRLQHAAAAIASNISRPLMPPTSRGLPVSG